MKSWWTEAKKTWFCLEGVVIWWCGPPGWSSLVFFCFSVWTADDTVSASSNMDMEDRVSHLEQKLQLQEDEIQLLKSALADALRRLGYCEEQAQGLHPGGAGRRPLAAAAPAQPTKGNWSEEMPEVKPLQMGCSLNAELNLRLSHRISNNHWRPAPCYRSGNSSDNSRLPFSASALASSSLQTCE